MNKNTVIFDLDGTLADITARKELATKSNGKLDWDVFHDPSNIKLDVPNEPVVKMAQMFAENDFTIIIFSGRTDKTMHTTRSWLSQHRIPFQKLIMRDSKINHFTPDDILKKDTLGLSKSSVAILVKRLSNQKDKIQTIKVKEKK